MIADGRFIVPLTGKRIAGTPVRCSYLGDALAKRIGLNLTPRLQGRLPKKAI
jgi:hypothetical protein